MHQWQLPWPVAVPGPELRHVTARARHHIRRGRRWRWRRQTARRQRTERRSPGAVSVNRSARNGPTGLVVARRNGPTGLVQRLRPSSASVCLVAAVPLDRPVLRPHTEAASGQCMQYKGLKAAPTMSPRPSPGDHASPPKHRHRYAF